MQVVESSAPGEQAEQPSGQGTTYRGSDRFNYDAIMGRPGMDKLMIGVDKVTGGVFEKPRGPDMLLAVT